MTKNIKSIFFVLTLVTLLATVGAVCAADDTNTTAAVDSSVSDVATVSETASDTVAAEPPQTTSNDNKVDTKTIEKEDKNLKTSTKTVEVNNYNDLTSAVNSAARDTENDEYIINLNTGSYQVGGWNNVQWTTSSSIDKTITINGNNQTLKMGQGRLTINNACNMIFNNVTLDESIDNYVNLTLKNVETTKQINNYKNLSLEDSLIGYTINNNGNLSVDDNTIFGNEVTISGYGIIITNDFDKLLPIISNLNGTYTIEDKNITLWKSNSGNLTFINCLITSRYSLDNYGNITLLNCTLNRTVNNYGILIISDDTTFDDNFVLKGSGQLIINDTDRIIPYMSSYNGTYVIENMSITSTKYNYGNLTLNNCNITGSFINYGNLTINNSTIKYLTNNENANLIMNNSFITGSTENYCNMSIFNTTINASISNSKGTLIISDDSIIGSSFGLSGNGEVVINDSNRIYNYTNTFNGTHTFDNLNITKNINVYGDITIRNSIINGMIQNRANLKLINCTINRNINNYINLTLEECSVNSKISNSGNITIDDETEFNESGVINGNGNITINDLNRIVLHIQNYNGTYTLENLTTLHTQLNNYGNLTLKNCTITPFGITNYANATLTLDNCTVNRSINNYGTIIILDNCILGNEFILYNYNDGKFITNDTQKLLPHLWSFNGTYTIDNANFTSTKGNYGNLTLNDCNISTIYNNGGNITSNNCNYRSGLDNYANGMYIINNSTLNNSYVRNDANAVMYINNCILNTTLNNNGIVYISDDTVIGSNFKLNWNGELVINDTGKIINYLTTLNTNYTVNNTIINTTKTNNANLTLNNCTINTTIVNNGVLIISDDTVFGENFILNGNGEVIINDSTRLIPYMNTYNGNYTINNMTFATSKTNNGNLTINDSTINEYFTNNGNLTINYSTINAYMPNYGNMDVNNSLINNTINNEMNLNITNSIINNSIYNSEGIITITNTTINKNVVNWGGNVQLINCTINSTIQNSEGSITISDDCIFTDNFTYNDDDGIELIMNDTDRLIPHLSKYNGTYTLENRTITTSKTNYGNMTLNNVKLNATQYSNYGNTTINNSNITSYIYNNGNITVNNSILNSTINNNGILVISDDTILGEEFTLTGNGEVIINDTDRLIPFQSVYNGNYTFINTTITKAKTNNANLTLINCDIRAQITNNGYLKIINMSYSNNNITQALIINNYQLTIEDSLFENNTMNNKTIITNNNKILINNSSFKNNKNTTNYIINGGEITIVNSVFDDNSHAITATTVNITNSTFKNNQYLYLEGGQAGGGSDPEGIVISSQRVYINNSTFDNNGMVSKHQYATYGGYGGVIHTENATIYNSTFTNNFVNTTSTWTRVVNPSGAAAAIYLTNGIIEGCIFENNTVSNPSTVTTTIGKESYGMSLEGNLGGSGADIYTKYGNVTINNNNFTNSHASNTAGSIYAYLSTNTNLTITNNNFTNIQSAHDTLVIEKAENTYYTINISNNEYNNCSIELNTLSLTAPDKIYEDTTIEINGTIDIANPEYYDEDLINKTKYQFYINGETINQDSLNFNITANNSNIIIYATPSTMNNNTNILVLKTTKLNKIDITPENYNNYIILEQLVGIDPDTLITFTGNFTNLGELLISTENITINGINASFTNTSFVIESNKVIMENMKINNTNLGEYAMTNYGNNSEIRNNNITQYNDDGKTAGILNYKASNVLINNNTINVFGPSYSISWEGESGIANTQGILSIGGQNNKITYNNITVANSTDSEQSAFGTIEAITAPQETNTTISYNNIYTTGARFAYGINTLDNVENNKIIYNNITVTGYRYTDGIQVGNGATGNIIANNNINLTCLNDTPVDEAAISYGIIITSQGGQTSDNNTITQNNILINGSVNYGIEIYTATNTLITENNITLTGVKSMGIGYAHSPNSTVIQNTITINDDSTQILNSVTEEIQPLSTGIRIQQNSDNIKIENNTIKTNDTGKTDTTINIENDIKNTQIFNNKLISSTGYSEDTITSLSNTIKENNTIPTTTTIEDITGVTNIPTTITVTVTSEYIETINMGSVIFTDTEGNTITTADVINGTATTTVTFTEATTTQITASYTPTSTGLETSTATTTLTIEEPQTQLSIEDVTLTAGETVTLTARVTDQLGNNITGGKIVFKVNGKTLKDENGKVIYAKVVNGIATADYLVPTDLNGKEVNITAVYSGSNKYDKATETITTTVTKTTPTLTTSDITASAGETITLTAHVTDNDKVINNGKVVFKVNGKTVKDASGKVIYAKVVKNQVSVNYTIPVDMKAKEYNLTATFISSDYDRLEDTKTLTVTG